MPIFAKLAYAAGVGVDELLFVRFVFGFIMIGLILNDIHRLHGSRNNLLLSRPCENRTFKSILE